MGTQRSSSSRRTPLDSMLRVDYSPIPAMRQNRPWSFSRYLVEIDNALQYQVPYSAGASCNSNLCFVGMCSYCKCLRIKESECRQGIPRRTRLFSLVHSWLLLGEQQVNRENYDNARCYYVLELSKRCRASDGKKKTHLGFRSTSEYRLDTKNS